MRSGAQAGGPPRATSVVQTATIDLKPAMPKDDSADAPDISTLLTEFGRRQNPYLVRDTSPHSAGVKTYWLELKRAPRPEAFDDIGMSVFFAEQ